MIDSVAVKLGFDIGRCRGKSMILEVRCNNMLISRHDRFEQDNLELSFTTNLPMVIEFHTSGKGKNDTIVDESGKIIEDMYIKLNKIQFDRIPIKKWILEKQYLYGVDSKKNVYQTNYIGYNGVTKIIVKQPNIFRHFLDILSG